MAHYDIDESDLLDMLNNLSKMLHNKIYEATKDYEETGNVFFDGQGEAFEMCKIFVDEIIKSV